MSSADAPGAQGQQPGRTETVKDKQGRKPGGSKTVKDRTRDKNVSRALGPDVVDDKGQRVPFSRRGWEPHSSDEDDGDNTTVPRASRQAKPGLPMPLTIAEDDYVSGRRGDTGLVSCGAHRPPARPPSANSARQARRGE